MYSLQTSLRTNPSIGFIRIEIILVAQYCHYCERSKFEQHHQITFSMIVAHRKCLIDRNSISLHLHKTNLTNFFFSYLAFLGSGHSPSFHAFSILCVAQTMANYKLPLAYLLRTYTGLIDPLKSNFSSLYFELQQPPKASFNCCNL
jgi:hypothetical protein